MEGETTVGKVLLILQTLGSPEAGYSSWRPEPGVGERRRQEEVALGGVRPPQIGLKVGHNVSKLISG